MPHYYTNNRCLSLLKLVNENLAYFHHRNNLIL